MQESEAKASTMRLDFAQALPTLKRACNGKLRTMFLVPILCSGLVTLSAFGRMVPLRDPVDGVLDAELVVIVQRSPLEKPGLFRILEVFLGNKKRDDLINVGDFTLAIVQQYGSPVIEPITEETRILLFLQRKQDSATEWEPTYFKDSFFWVQRPQEVALLRRAAERAVDLRQQWEHAADIVDPKQRVAALWPFLAMPRLGVSFFKHTESELQKAKPPSGEYFAEHLDDMSHNERMSLLPSAGAYGSDMLHEKLKSYLNEQRQRYEQFVAAFGRRPRDIEWNSMPDKIKDVQGELYYGLGGLAKFDDRNDLPYIRRMAIWAAQYHLEQTAEAAVNAFRDMPDRANLPAIQQVLNEFLPDRKPGMWTVVDWDTERALCTHKYLETIPLLAPFVADAQMATEAVGCLQQIVGRDLGQDPKAWMDWYLTTRTRFSTH
jgi:hypothetical protein